MQVKKEEKKRAIVESALKLVVEKGIDDVSTDEIARRARVGKGTIYVYFKSKDEILEAVVESVYNSFTEDIRIAIENSKNVENFIENLAERLFERMEIRGRILHMFHRSYKDYRKVYERFKSEYKKELKKAYKKFDLKVDFDTFYFVLTSFLMSSYILSKDLDLEKVKEIVKNSLLKILK